MYIVLFKATSKTTNQITTSVMIVASKETQTLTDNTGTIAIKAKKVKFSLLFIFTFKLFIYALFKNGAI